MIAINAADIFIMKISLHYGVWILPLFIVFYGIVNTRIIKKSFATRSSSEDGREKRKGKLFYFDQYDREPARIEERLPERAFREGELLFDAPGNESGLTHEECEELSVAALLHDIGYVGVPMDKFSRMNIINLEDIQKIRYHPVIGAEILRKSSLFSRYADIILYHHENWNGTGYPFGLSGSQIPFYSRIIQIADTFDSLTTDRFYRTALNKHDALLIIRSGKGQDFDPHLAEMFIECLK
jgi:putative nucleotidyltransferase with HDIG domain